MVDTADMAEGTACISSTKSSRGSFSREKGGNMVLDGSGWWLTYPSEKYEFVSWDDSSQPMGKSKQCSSHHQLVMVNIEHYPIINHH
jgi:hypothetical protein